GDLAAAGQLPDADGAIDGGRQHPLAIGKTGGGGSEILVALFELDERAARAVPDPRGAVAAGGDDAVAVGRECRSEDGVAVTLGVGHVDHAHFLVTVQVPDLHLLVVARGEEPPALALKFRTEGDGMHAAAVTAER